MKKICEEVSIALRQANDRTKEQFDAHAQPAQEYSPGDKVYLEATNLKTNRPSRKLDDKRFGPFEVLEKIGRSAYKLKLPESWKGLHPVFNESYLSPYRPSRFSQQMKPPPPPPIDIEGEPQYEVEEVRDSQRHRGHLQYLVHWKGYSREEDTWEPMSHLSHAPEHVHEFHTKYPDKPSPTNNIRILNISPDQKQQLFNPITNTPGINFTMTTPHQTSSNDDVIISLPQNTVDKIFTEGIHVFRFPWRYFPPIPPLTKRVWIYEPSPIQSITCVACFDPVSQHPVGLYQLINPPSKEVLRGQYDFQTKLIPAVAPAWLVRDYGKQVLRVW